MAILDTKTKYYYKIDFDECFIKGEYIIPNFEIYKSEEERIKEKERAPKINDALLKMRKDSDYYYKLMMAVMSKYDLADMSLYLEEDGMTIKREEYPEAYEFQRKHFIIENLFQILVQPVYFKRTETYPAELRKFSDSEYATMEEYGIKKEWLDDYIKIIDKASTTVGRYSENDNINIEYYYNKLKPVMVNEIIDC